MRTIFTSGVNRSWAGKSLTFGACVIALCAAAPAAEAAFTLAPCTGSSITGRGASFQQAAQAGFNAFFQSSDSCSSGAPTVTYDPGGSGAGRRALGERGTANPLGLRDVNVRFGGTDDPPNPTQTGQIENGPDAAGDEDLLHVIPVAIGANAVNVNYPNGCAIPAASLANPPASGDQTDRIKLPAALIEAAFYADTNVDTWGELVSGITGTPSDATLGATCAAVPIRRVVRQDDSGTTFIQKDWLNKVKPDRSPAWSSFLASPNTTWPNTVNPSTGPSCPVNSNLCKPTAANAGNQLDLLNVTDGGIGYADLATSRDRGFNMTPNMGDTTFWVPIVNSAGAAFEPSQNPGSYKSTSAARGANCSGVAFANVPAAGTRGSWVGVTGTGGTGAGFYPICGLTWDLAFDDYAEVYGGSSAEEAKARTVKDYLGAAVSPLGQATLAPRDYTPLSPSLRSIAQTGVNAIKFGGGTITPPPPPPPPPAEPPPPGPPPGPPSNSFTIPSVKTTSKKTSASFKLTVQLPGAGKLAARATSSYKSKGKTKKVTLGSVTGTATSAGTVSVTIKVGPSGRAALKKAGKLKVKIAVQFIPDGGTARTVNKTVTIKKPKK